MQIASCESTGRVVSFEWSHHRISSIESKVKVTLQNPIKQPGSERVKTKSTLILHTYLVLEHPLHKASQKLKTCGSLRGATWPVTRKVDKIVKVLP